ncbi:cryptochrome/photolyase family protein [Nocardioides caldifontis]|uniref:cryptochrome/photolyase family protein n=1 Tax=Nocardioides caldifontis TaxID=2588938 RepID=UPI001EF02510|nr:deoxyribodipyrimidine photo-lyase [Nocardioides caldifontis]
MANTAVMWFRRDLRLADNPALLAACEADGVVPLFVVDPALWGPAGAVRRTYLAGSLTALDASMGGVLVVRHGDPREVVPAVAAEVGADRVHVAADFAPYGARRDAEVEEALGRADVGLARLGSPYAVAPGRVRNGSGEAYRVYSPFSRAWAEHGWRGPVGPPRSTRWLRVDGDGIPDAAYPDGTEPPTPGEQAALAAWADFRDHRLDRYGDERDQPASGASSEMSTYLRWGEIHPRTMLADLARRRSDSAAKYRKELAWREFYADVLWRHPESARADLRPEYAELQYDDPGTLFEAWKEGRTGFPIVDAGMRQLRGQGRIHNRVRMIVASFLVKDLHVWWRHGARHFMEWLADGDLASNQHGWQWVAGSGTDPAPYFRVFNPTTQGRKFDPDGAYVRRWVPELRDVPAPEVHEPVGVPGYPAPIVDHAAERKEALARYDRIKAAAAGR